MGVANITNAVPQQTRGKPYRIYRGGHVRKDDPEAARFAFERPSGAAVVDGRPSTPEGLPRPRSGGPSKPLPGRKVASVPPSGRRWHLGWKRGILLGLTLALVLFGGYVYLGYREFADEVAKANDRVDAKTMRALEPAGRIISSPQVTLILGSDRRGGETVGRADSILLMRTDPDKGLISLLSIPRDLRVPIAGRGDQKINAAFSFGGAPLLIRTVNKLTGFKVNHIMLVDFEGFVDLIDSMGGVEIWNPRFIQSAQNFDGQSWRFPQGTITLNGKRALAYARIRKTTNPQDTDISRTQRQQVVMQAITRELVSPWSMLKLNEIGRDVARPLGTDMSANELIGAGWVKFRASRTIECHLGGTPQSIDGQDMIVSSPQNRGVIQMFLGEQAPLPAAKGQIWDPGCRIQ
jgi:polyisoprenyl-teichoic acid--peptidoglycan teichoic acid transferase